MKNLYRFVLIAIVFFSCAKINSNTLNHSFPKSEWTIKNYSFQNDRPMQINDYGNFRTLFNYDSVILFYTSVNMGIEKSDSKYYSELIIDFLSPIVSKTYAVVGEEISIPYNPKSCIIKFGSFTHPFGNYTSIGKLGDSVKVVISDNTVTATFKNVTLMNDSATNFNTPPHLELISGTLVGARD